MSEFEICVSSQLTELGGIAQFITERARAAGLDDQRVFDVQMAVDEASTNTINHAYGGRQDGQLRVCCFVDGDDFVVRIIDQGAPFDPETVPSPDLDAPIEERQVGGLGLYFMRQLMDEVRFFSDPDHGNVLLMRKRRA